MAKIREDLVGVVTVGGVHLSAGDTVPDGVTVGDHVLAPAEKAEEPAKEPEEAPKPRRRRKADPAPDGEE